jgi:hypothetical protein
VGGKVISTESWAWVSGGGHCLKAVGAVWARSARGSDQETDTQGPPIFFIIPKLSKLAQHKKMKMGTLTCSKNSQFLHVGRLGYYEHVSQLCRHPIPNRSRAKNAGIDSIFEFLLNFKRGLNLPEKSGKFPKILT